MNGQSFAVRMDPTRQVICGKAAAACLNVHLPPWSCFHLCLQSKIQVPGRWFSMSGRDFPLCMRNHHVLVLRDRTAQPYPSLRTVCVILSFPWLCHISGALSRDEDWVEFVDIPVLNNLGRKN